MAGKRTREYLENLVDGARPHIDRFLPGLGTKLVNWARARAGGTRRHQDVSALDKAALAGLTKEGVKALSNDDLWRLHKTCHRQAAAMAKRGMKLTRSEGRILVRLAPREIQ